MDDTLPPNIFSAIKVEDFVISSDDHVWTCKIAMGEFLNLLKNPHEWVSSRVLITNAKGQKQPAILADHFVIYFQDMPVSNQGLSGQQVLVHGIHETSALTVHLSKSAITQAIANNAGQLPFNYFSGNAFLPSFVKGMSGAFGKAMVPFLPNLNPDADPNPADEHSFLEPLNLHKVEDRVYVHAEIGKSRAVVAGHLFGAAVTTQQYLADMHSKPEQRFVGETTLLKGADRLEFNKDPNATISFIYQGVRGGNELEFASGVCNIAGGTTGKAVNIDYMLAKAWTTLP